jgi:hypothetical protein
MTRLRLGFPPRDMVIKNRLFWKQETIARFQFDQRAKGTTTRLQNQPVKPRPPARGRSEKGR